MRRLASASLLAVALLLIFAAPSLAWDGHRHGGPRVFVSVGPRFWWGPYPYPYYYYPYPYYYTPPPVVVQDPPVYVQQQQVSPSVVPPAPSGAQESFWYYCPSSRDYYPQVPSCPEAWIKVPPRQE
jgi:hypothetical protein